MTKKPKKKPGRPKTTGTTPMRSLRINDERWERWRDTASARGLTLVEWITEACERQARRDEKRDNV